MVEGKEKALAQIVVEEDAVTLYYVGEALPERIPRETFKRATISLRDPAGPLVWVELVEDDPASESDS